MRKNKKNWEIFSKSWKENAIVCDHFPTTPALVTTTHNRENNMIVETMNEGVKKYLPISEPKFKVRSIVVDVDFNFTKFKALGKDVLYVGDYPKYDEKINSWVYRFKDKNDIPFLMKEKELQQLTFDYESVSYIPLKVAQ